MKFAFLKSSEMTQGIAIDLLVASMCVAPSSHGTCLLGARFEIVNCTLVAEGLECLLGNCLKRSCVGLSLTDCRAE